MNYLKRKRPLIDGDAIANTQQAANSDESARNEFWIRLDKALDALPIEQKTAFVLTEIWVFHMPTLLRSSKRRSAP